MTENELKNQIGEELYEKLSQEDKELMLKTAGSIDFGEKVDLLKSNQEKRWEIDMI